MFIALFLMWIILNGAITWEIVLIGLAVSAALTLFWHRVFGGYSGRILPSPKTFGNGVCYVLTLIWEMIRSNLQVMGMILQPSTQLRPQLVLFHSGLKKETSNTVLANSITLTPGTITVSMEGDAFCVHALDASLAKDLGAGPLAQRLGKMEEM